MMKDISDYFQLGKWGKKKILNQKEISSVIEELSYYVYYQTVLQIWECQEGRLSEEDARKVLDDIASILRDSCHINNVPEKLEEFRRADNDLYQLARNITRILGRKSIHDIMEVLIPIAGRVQFELFDRVRLAFSMTEDEIDDFLKDFWKPQ